MVVKPTRDSDGKENSTDTSTDTDTDKETEAVSLVHNDDTAA